MPGRKPKPPRLHLKRQTGRPAAWIVLDRGKQYRTGYHEGERERAEEWFADYLVRKYRPPVGPSDSDEMTIDRALIYYGQEHAPHTAAPATLGYNIDALLTFWSGKPVSAIKGETCRAYVRHRSSVKASTARRELGTLGAALNYCEREGYLIHAPRVWLPKVAKGRRRWLTRTEAARLLWAARRTPHLATFILIGLYTGTRSSAILRLQWGPSTVGGWIDLENGLLHRAPEDWVETNKRQPTCSLPRKLIGHLRRVRARTRQHVIEFNGKRLQKVRRSWRQAANKAGLGPEVVPHILRHTAVTWRLQRGIGTWETAGYVGMDEKTVREVYGHHHPDHQLKARDAY